MTVVRVSGNREFRKSFKECYFLSDPRSFALTHLPLDGDSILAEDQLLDDPVTDAREWTDTALRSPLAHALGIQPITHPNALVQTTTGLVKIEFESAFPMKQFLSVSLLTKKRNTTEALKGAHIQKQVKLKQCGNKSEIIANLKQHGDVRVVVCGVIQHGHPSLARQNCLLDYMLSFIEKRENTITTNDF